MIFGNGDRDKRKTYYIVRENSGGTLSWIACEQNIMTRLGIFDRYSSGIADTFTMITNIVTEAEAANVCEQRLRAYLEYKNIKPTIVRIVRI